MPKEARLEALKGARAIVPLAIGVLAYGLAFGLLAAQAGFTWAETGLMGVLVFAGSSQIVAVERLAAGAGVAAALIAGVALNLRLLLITASVRGFFAGRPLWQRILGAHLSADENWALTLAHRARGERVGYWFLVGAGMMLVVVWVVAGVLGVIFAARIPDPERFAIDFAFTAAFLAIARALWRGRPDLAPWAIAVAVVIVTTWLGWFDASWAIVLGGLSGALISALKSNA